jgi:hypothetical protein
VGSLLELLAAGERNVDVLSDAGHLREAAGQVAASAVAHGATHLVAASPAAERVVGAALLMSPRLRALMYTQGDVDLSGEAVLVVDVNLASGTAIAHAARRARQGGATHVRGAVLHALWDAVGPQECGLDGLEILQR